MKPHSQHSPDFFYISAASHRLRARWIYPSFKESAHTLVFLHEGLGSIPQWRNFPQRLVDLTGCKGLMYERYGFGGSDELQETRNDRYLHDEAELALPEVLEKCQIKNPIFVGHSDGGSIVLLYAAAFPTQVHAVITEAAHVFGEHVTLKGIQEATVAFEKGHLKEKLARFHGDKTETMFRGWSDTWLSPEFQHWNIEDCLPKIICPLLVIQGQDDEYATVSQVNSIARQVSGSVETHILPNCGHVPHQQASDQTLQIMTQFITQLP